MHYITTQLKQLILACGRIAISERNNGLAIDYKQDGSPVTIADKIISDMIYEKLSLITPNIPVVCEEREVINLDKALEFWLIDPIDGTKSFIKGQDTFTINLCLIRNGLPSWGMIYQPALKKLYYTNAEGVFTVESDGVILETAGSELVLPEYKLLTVGDTSQVGGSTAVIGSRSMNKETRDFIAKHRFTQVFVVSSSLKLCLVAEGSVDIYPKFGPIMDWDIAAGHAIIKSAGGTVVDINGNELTYGNANMEKQHFLAQSRSWLIKNKGKLV